MTLNDRIRNLFLASRATYTVAEAAELLNLSWAEVRGWLETGEVEGIETGRGLVLPWAEVVFMGMEWWGQEAVEEALGEDRQRALPELVQLAELRVRLPRYEIAAVERVAAREGKSVDAVVARELLDFVSAEAEWLTQEVPGFAAALAWPGSLEK
jgi:excisionase family DNA binding protein